MLNEGENKTLVIGIGNTGRQDDGLGWNFLDLITDQKNPILDTDGKNPVFDTEYRYQLQVEDADLISRYSRVIFIDSTLEKTTEGFYFRAIEPKGNQQLLSHALSPETVLHLCSSIYNIKPICFILGIEGQCWDLNCGLSEMASINLRKAKNFWMEKVYCLPLEDKS